MRNLQIEHILIHALRPRDRNARIHSPRQINQIRDSILKFGFNNPILIDDENRIIAGHGRFEAAKGLNMATVPAVRLSHLSEIERRAYIIADNRLAELAGWDPQILAIDFRDLIDLGFDVTLTGFETPQIDLILEETRDATDPALMPDDQVPEPSVGPPVSPRHPVSLLHLVCTGRGSQGRGRICIPCPCCGN